MNYISLDLELNNDPNGSTPDPKIIQVGISIGSLADGIKLTKSWFIDPGEALYPFITVLTGITQYEVDEQSVSLKTVADEISQLIKEYKCFVNPVTWGCGDAAKLIKEFKLHGVYFPHFGRRELDVKQIHVFQMLSLDLSPNSSLSSCVKRHKMTFAGTPHRADCDAENTLRLFFKFMNDYKNLKK